MLKTLRIIFSLLGVFVAGYGLVTENYEYQPAMLFSLSLTMLFQGLEEFQKDKKAAGWFSMVAFLFTLFVSIEVFRH